MQLNINYNNLTLYASLSHVREEDIAAFRKSYWYPSALEKKNKKKSSSLGNMGFFNMYGHQSLRETYS